MLRRLESSFLQFIINFDKECYMFHTDLALALDASGPEGLKPKYHSIQYKIHTALLSIIRSLNTVYTTIVNKVRMFHPDLASRQST